MSRCRTIANALVEADQSVSGPDPVGLADDRILRIPLRHRLRACARRGQADRHRRIRLRQPPVGVEHTMELRTRIIRDTADIFRPDLFIVDKEPLGLRGEVGPALRLLKDRGTPLVLGLRDVMDDPAALAQEWGAQEDRAGAARPLRRDLDLRPARRSTSRSPASTCRHRCGTRRSIPATCTASCRCTPTSRTRSRRSTGRSSWSRPAARRRRRGSGRLVLAAYEHDPHIPYGAVIVFGPFMSATARESFKDRARSSGISAPSPSPTISAR